MSVPLFSILIAHYNNAHFFKDCYQSIISQTFQDFEVIVVDDCSLQEEFESVKDLITHDNRFKLYRNDSNKGVGYTKRKLIEFSTGDICGFVDPDDTITSDAVEIMIEAHKNNPNASIINSNLNFCDNKLLHLRATKINQIENFNPFYFNFNGNISHFATFKKEFYNKTSKINSYFRIAEDQDLYLKLYEVGESLQINNSLYNYRLNPKSLTNSSVKEITTYWHWVAAIHASERRKINIENLFINQFGNKSDFEKEVEWYRYKSSLLKKSRLLKFLNKIGIFKAYKYL